MNPVCARIGHSIDTLYPKSQYQCEACGLVHGTFAYGGAVCWSCPREGIKDENYHEPAKQIYLGENCSRCGELLPPETVLDLIRQRQEWHRTLLATTDGN